MTQDLRLDDNRSATAIILAAGLFSLILYGFAATVDLQQRLGLYLALHATLAGLMLLAWWKARGTRSALRIIVLGAALFRLVTVFAEPTLSDDLYRYVWDGRVQVAGIHPFAHAPVDDALESLRGDDWTRINHPELRTIYPPAAQMLFAVLAFFGAGTTGFKLVFALADLGVVAALALLLRRTGLPGDRLLLYAWNPLAVIETAGSGHIEPVGVALVVLCAAWLVSRRAKLSAVALALAVQVKILPAVLIPGAIRRWRNPAVLVLAGVLVALALPYAVTGPALGSGLFDYAERWERNATIYSGVQDVLERLDSGNSLKPAVGALRERFGGTDEAWGRVYARIWPREIAHVVVGFAAVCWLLALSFRRGLTAPREIFLGLAGVLLLAPTLHPWYVLWVLPFAAAYASVPWLLFAALVPLAYLGSGGDVPLSVRGVEYGLPLAAAVILALRRRAERLVE
jgi:hypothetical protein